MKTQFRLSRQRCRSEFCISAAAVVFAQINRPNLHRLKEAFVAWTWHSDPICISTTLLQRHVIRTGRPTALHPYSTHAKSPTNLSSHFLCILANWNNLQRAFYFLWIAKVEFHLSLPRPFTLDLKFISFTNSFLHHSYSFRTAFTDLNQYCIKGPLACLF